MHGPQGCTSKVPASPNSTHPAQPPNQPSINHEPPLLCCPSEVTSTGKRSGSTRLSLMGTAVYVHPGPAAAATQQRHPGQGCLLGHGGSLACTPTATFLSALPLTLCATSRQQLSQAEEERREAPVAAGLRRYPPTPLTFDAPQLCVHMSDSRDSCTYG
jgi:hypothetical protein